MSALKENPTDVLIAGWGHSRFGKLAGETVESLVVAAGREALASARLVAEDIDEIVVGNFNSGMNKLAFPASLALQIDPALRLRPATRVENACSSGAAAVRVALTSIRSGAAKNVLVIGVEKMTHLSSVSVGEALLGASYEYADHPLAGGFAAMFADIQREYEARYGDMTLPLARIAAKNHANGMLNPWAHMHKELSVEFCSTVSEKNPVVAGRIKRTDCSPISDGAAALVLTTRQRAAAQDRPSVRLAALRQANDYLPVAKKDPTEFLAPYTAWHAALAESGMSQAALDFVEVHDCFTIAELVLYEALGFAEPGRGSELLANGSVYRDGVLPVNPSGGLKAKGHPVGATGVSQLVVSAMQVSGTAGDMQLPNARVAGILNMGGAAVSAYATVLEGEC